MGPEELSARLHELAGSVRVERMSPAGVQRRVKARARRRRLRRGLGSVALTIVAVFAGAGSWSSQERDTTRVVTDGPVSPAATAGLPPTLVAVPQPSPSTTTTAPAPAPPTAMRPGPEDDKEGPERDMRTDATTRSDPDDTGPRSN